ncbi:hypothetical protein [Cellulomonas rhizosphaerae]|uniref:Uncharacterized protein n=1 Tax=Cellulomonas rhizosphaerae TaxID=2293719 RepID=A0A413RL12_9CELL|nr:hypothetical protein [Cellulomonas rhizosphaerae]RHA40260.1 hypothetical protein D1825_10505 [Cellulomonas rhizosphaerae]
MAADPASVAQAHAVAAAMRAMGYPDAHVADDAVRATRALVLVSPSTATVQRSDLQWLVGQRGYETFVQLFVFAAGGFSAQSMQYGQHMDVALFTLDPAGRVAAQSPAAHRMSARRAGQTTVVTPPADRSRWWKRRS